MKSNFERMIQMAEDVFATKNDPAQLDINPQVIERLQTIHPSTVSEYTEGNGPIAWVLVLPTSTALMRRFLQHDISEKELFELTTPGGTYEALYLCSAMVLEEYRRKGIAKNLVLKAVEDIRKEHPLKSMFVWSFTKEGDFTADALARKFSMPLFKRIAP